jgi:hypothetical protein
MIAPAHLLTVCAILGLPAVSAKTSEYRWKMSSAVTLSHFEIFYKKSETKKNERCSCLPKETVIPKPNPLILFFPVLKTEPDGVDYLLGLQ